PPHDHYLDLIADFDRWHARLVEKFAERSPAFRLEPDVDDYTVCVDVDNLTREDISFLKVSQRSFIELLHFLFCLIFLYAGIDRLYHATPPKDFLRASPLFL